MIWEHWRDELAVIQVVQLAFVLVFKMILLGMSFNAYFQLSCLCAALSGAWGTLCSAGDQTMGTIKNVLQLFELSPDPKRCHNKSPELYEHGRSMI